MFGTTDQLLKFLLLICKNKMISAVVDFLFDSDDDDDEFSTSTNYSTTSSDSSDDEEMENHQSIANFEGVINSYSDADFQKHLRLHRVTAFTLIDRYKLFELSQNSIKRGLPKVSPEKNTYMFLWYMANTNTFRELANLFGVSKSTAWHYIKKFSIWLISIGHEFVKWPNENQIFLNTASFQERAKISGIVGCIDGSHIKIKAPTENKESYFNRKKYYSISLQGVVDANKKFIDVFVGEPGSLHDSRVLRRSELFKKITENRNIILPHNTVLLGDSAYPCLDWLIPPFRDHGMLTDAEKQFNKLHSSGRVVVEHAFGLLKTRFRRLLHFTEQTKINLVVNLVMCACILHNMCSDIYIEVEVSDNNISASEGTAESTAEATDLETGRRQQMINDLLNRNVIQM